MKQKSKNLPRLIPLLRAAIGTLYQHKVIMFPYLLMAFCELFLLEILYFYPRWPLRLFFGPLLLKFTHTDAFLHYPHNFALLPKLFFYAKIPLYLFVSSFLITLGIHVTFIINEDRKVMWGAVIRRTLSSYVHILLGAFIAVLSLFALFRGSEIFYHRIAALPYDTGIYSTLKNIILKGSPYINLLLSILITTLFAYVFPIIIIEKKKIVPALAMNFKILFRSFWVTFMLILLPSLLLIPVTILRSGIVSTSMFPELSVIFIIISILIMALLNAVIYTALTIFYLLKREQ